MTEISLTVNGTAVDLDVEPRITLADALRHNLNLTGTHVGCEHGVCGACTVLVDGTATRSCLMFAVQAQGSEVTTVEALGRADDLHPLQEAFKKHHGLQCGFCTPGFLMSAYELLRDGVEPDEDRIAEELSGVICRCTGYRGIVAAVREVAEREEPLPEPSNVGLPIVVVSPGGAPPTVPARPPEEAAVASVDPKRFDLAVPEGEPNALVDVSTEVGHGVAETWELLSDFPRMTRCLPGVELSDLLGDDTYGGHAQLHMGPLRFSFAGAARVIERDDAGRSLRAVGAGSDVSGGGVRADLRFSAEPAGEGRTVVRAQARLYLTGRAAQFGRSLVGDVSRQLFEEFGRCVDRTLTTGEVAEPVRLRGGALARRAVQGQARAVLQGIRRRWRERRGS
ncbi:MAG: aerobic carbon-monoxide dehydrogenase small subunit [Solirubrobacteraceae bacterium]|jgi:xanthine dehydrogenase YagT iron-sulfur-binding subunit|nr:aerobic carbon-monoxide dehydrogenase small subunit [Solirubrobacteraceae bacterium]